MNRLTTSQEGATWSQTNSYDRYGNRAIVGAALSFNASNNRITNAGYTYDAVGNLTNDSTQALTYDAENKITKVDNVAAYVYDGEGQRVRKFLNENLRFVYGIGGQLIAEFSGVSGALQKEYIYGASGLVATIEPTAVNANGTRYTTSDHLGSPRVVTSSAAAVISRHDFKPFGEEIGAGIGARTTGIGYVGVADGLRQKFTSYERDNETGLDYAQARYYAGQQGRFSSADPLLSSGSVYDPQTWNRYAYTLNNPLRYIDPLGLYEWDASLGGSATDAELKKRKGGQKIIDKRNEFRKALAQAAANSISNSISERQRCELWRSVEAYGNEGEANGVAVGSGRLENGARAETAFAKDASGRANPFSTKGSGPWTVNANIRVMFDGKIDEDAVAHEGSHVADRLDLVAVVEAVLNSENDREINSLKENLTKYATEFRAYQVSSSVDQVNNRTSAVWNRGWSEADRTTAINKLLRDNKLYKVSPPGTKPGPGPKILE